MGCTSLCGPKGYGFQPFLVINRVSILAILVITKAWFLYSSLTAPFNNMRTLKFKAQRTNAFFATVNQIFGGSSQLPTMLSELNSAI